MVRMRVVFDRVLSEADPVDIAGTGVLVVDLVAGTTRLIATTGGADQPVWSPDGKRIAYRGFAVTGSFTKESGIWVVDVRSGQIAEFMRNESYAASAALAQEKGAFQFTSASTFGRVSQKFSNELAVEYGLLCLDHPADRLQLRIFGIDDSAGASLQ